MLKMFKTHRNTIGNLMIVLMFVGGCTFMLIGSWDAPETEAASSGGGEIAATTLAAGCCGGNGIAMGAETIASCCGGKDNVPIASDSNDNDDSDSNDNDDSDDNDDDDDCLCLSGNPCSYCSNAECGGNLNSCPGSCGCEPECCALDCREAGDPCSGLNETTNKCTNED